MKLEHVAFLVADPAAMASWYEQHLAMRVVRKGDGPGHARFVADETGASVLELYAGALPVPDYRGMDPALLHVAFVVQDVRSERARLIAAGASAVGEISASPTGDQFAMLRDPWGLALQLAQRARPLV